MPLFIPFAGTQALNDGSQKNNARSSEGELGDNASALTISKEHIDSHNREQVQSNIYLNLSTYRHIEYL